MAYFLSILRILLLTERLSNTFPVCCPDTARAVITARRSVIYFFMRQIFCGVSKLSKYSL
jgi:hypothetical protein